MAKTRKESFSMLALLRQLLEGAVAWSTEEIDLTKRDAKALLHRYLVGLGLLVGSFAVLTAAMFTLAQTLIGALADFLFGHTFAGLVVSLVMFGLVAIMLVLARYLFRRGTTPEGVVFQRLLARRPKS